MSSFMRQKLSLCFSKAKCLPPSRNLKNDDRLSISSPASTPTSDLLNMPSSVDDPLSSPSSSFEDSRLRLPAVYALLRFFSSSPGQSNSIIESCMEIASAAACLAWEGEWGPGSILRSGRFQKSVVDARELMDVKKDLDDLHELLLCYLR